MKLLIEVDASHNDVEYCKVLLYLHYTALHALTRHFVLPFHTLIVSDFFKRENFAQKQKIGNYMLITVS